MPKQCAKMHRYTFSSQNNFNLRRYIMSTNVRNEQIEEPLDELDHTASIEGRLSGIMSGIGRSVDSDEECIAELDVLPLEIVLPMDIVQKILSFNHFSVIRVVSKTFKKCFDRNQDIARRLRPNIVDEYAHHFAPARLFDESVNKTFVLRPTGTPSMESIQAIEGEVIVHTKFKDCVNDHRLSAGDRILIQDGCYVMEDMWIIRRDVEVIGLGNSVEIKFVLSRFPSIVCAIIAKNIILKNITLSGAAIETGTETGGFLAVARSTLWLDTVTFERFGGITGGTIHAKACEFIRTRGVYAINPLAMDKTKYSNVIGCTFDKQWRYIRSENPIRCIGNVFGGSIGCLRCQFPKFLEQSMIKGNVFEGSINDEKCQHQRR